MWLHAIACIVQPIHHVSVCLLWQLGRTPLMYACGAGKLQCARLLMNALQRQQNTKAALNRSDKVWLLCMENDMRRRRAFAPVRFQ